jgi:hypothetical protein
VGISVGYSRSEGAEVRAKITDLCRTDKSKDDVVRIQDFLILITDRKGLQTATVV